MLFVATVLNCSAQFRYSSPGPCLRAAWTTSHGYKKTDKGDKQQQQQQEDTNTPAAETQQQWQDQQQQQQQQPEEEPTTPSSWQEQAKPDDEPLLWEDPQPHVETQQQQQQQQWEPPQEEQQQQQQKQQPEEEEPQQWEDQPPEWKEEQGEAETQQWEPPQQEQQQGENSPPWEAPPPETEPKEWESEPTQSQQQEEEQYKLENAPQHQEEPQQWDPNPNDQSDEPEPQEPTITVPWPGPDSTYDWSDVNLTVKGACGWHKCFFPSVSNSTIGYLVVSSTEYRAMKIADDVARDIHERFGSKHFHLALDRDVVSQEFKDHINSLVVQPNRANAGLDPIPILGSKHGVVIQKVILAPEPAFFFAVMSNNYKKSIAQLNDFAPKIPDKQAFGEQLTKEQARLVQVLDYMPGLVRDLQGLIDIHGNFYHIDLDGHVHLQTDPLEHWEVPRAKAGLLQIIANLTVGGSVSF